MSNAVGPTRRWRRTLGAVLLTALLVPACTGDDDDAVVTTTAAVTTTTIVERTSDGILKIGMYLPLTGPGASIGTPMVTGIQDAVEHINENGGVLGRDVVLEQSDEGSETIDRILETGVDAIVGPASSIVALSGMAPAVDAATGVVTCSPSATARALDDYPRHNFFFRTAPSDTLQMTAIARYAERTGTQDVAVGYLDDPYGRGLAQGLSDALEGRPLSAEPSVGFNGDQGDLTPVAEELLAGDPGVVVVLGDADDGSRLLATLDEATDDPPVVIINDSIRQARQVIQGLSDPFREQLVGIAPQSGPVSSADLGFFVAHAIDCVNLIALATIDAGTDDPSKFRARMSSVSTGGRACTTFEQCAELIGQGLGIDYNGLSGRVDLSATGDPTRAYFEVFGFNADGEEVHDDPMEVAVGG